MQTTVVAVIVFLSVAYLLRVFLISMRKTTKTNCSGCGKV